VAESVVGAIAPQLERAEIDRAKRKPTESLDAYDYYLRGMANFHQRTREAVSEAEEFLRTPGVGRRAAALLAIRSFDVEPDGGAECRASGCVGRERAKTPALRARIGANQGSAVTR